VKRKLNSVLDEHLQCVVEGLPKELTNDERQQVVNLLQKNSDVFSKSEYYIGRTNVVQHHIDTGANRPFKQQLRRHPYAHLEVIDKNVEEMLENDIIEPSAAPYMSNFVLVKKADQSLRLCLDYRQLNRSSTAGSYPLPRIESCLDSLGGARYYSTLDCRSGFWQVPMDEESKDKTLFVTCKGLWRFKVLPYGLHNSPALFQRLVDCVLAGLAWQSCVVYVYDVVVYANDFEQHLERLSIVFDRCQKANLKLKPSKCRLCQLRTKFLGHIVSEKGIEPDEDEEKVRSIVEWPVPKNLTEARAFVALACYYFKHIRNFAAIVKPIHELTQKGRVFLWIERQQEAFMKLKDRLIHVPIL
jgi:hypothetical protein